MKKALDMMNLSSLSKARFAAVAGFVGSILLTAYGLQTIAVIAVPLAILPLLMIYIILQIQTAQKAIAMANEVMAAAARGNLEARATRINFQGEVADLLHNLNRMLDLSDAFVREAKVSMARVAKGEFYRRVIETGLVGSFKDSAREINQTTIAMEQKVRRFSRSDRSFRARHSWHHQSIGSGG